MKYFIYTALLLLSLQAIAQEEHFGLYTNMSASEGHFGGYEILYVPNRKVVFQEAEGWPKDPIILDMGSDKDNEYVATHPEMGKMIFAFEKDKVTINFVGMRYIQVLNKGQSFWQK